MQDQLLSRLSGDEILAILLDALSAERQASADYHTQAESCRLLREMNDLAETFETLGDVERDHARRLASRIVALGGSLPQPTVRAQLGGKDLSEWLVHDLRAEQWAIVEYARLISATLDDDVTAELMTELLLDELRHARWLSTTLRAQAARMEE